MKREIFLVVFVCGSVGACAGHDSRVNEIKTAQDLKSKMDAGSFQVIHALDAENYGKGHIPGALNIDYEKMTVTSLPADKGQGLIFYCAGGMCPVGRMAANKAAGWGYSNVWVYEGGMKDWRSSGMTVATGK